MTRAREAKDISLYEQIPRIENDFGVKLLFCREVSRLLPHWHENIELLYIYKGSAELCTDGRICTVKAGDLVAVNGTEVHSFVSRQRMDYVCILIYPSFFADIDTRGLRFQNLIRDDARVKELVGAIVDEYERRDSGHDMMIKSHTYALIAHLQRQHPSTEIDERSAEARQMRLHRLDGVMKYISENYSERITTKELADMCFLSESHFCRFFKTTIGKTSIEYINEFRIQKASVLLTNTDESISRIATAVGFDDINYFTRMFKRATGMPPGEYRACVPKEMTLRDTEQ